MSYVLSSEAAEFYESTFVPALFASWASHIVASVRPGESVLDVACGTGVVARAAAARGALAEGLDSNEAMLAVARRLSPSLSWQHGSAESLPFLDGSFDAVLSQAAVMFFTDRVAGLREMGRVARDRVLVQVPGRLACSPGYRALSEVVGRHGGPPAVALIGGYFSVGEPAVLRDLFAAAGLRISHWSSWMSATRLASLSDFLAVELLPLASVPGDVRERIVADCRVELAEFCGPDGSVAAPLEVHLVEARRE